MKTKFVSDVPKGYDKITFFKSAQATYAIAINAEAKAIKKQISPSLGDWEDVDEQLKEAWDIGWRGDDKEYFTK